MTAHRAALEELLADIDDVTDSKLPEISAATLSRARLACGGVNLRNNLRNEILEAAALIADQIDDCRGSTYDNGCTDDGYGQAKRQIADAIRQLKVT
jgi:hypothetical protein